MGLNGVEVILNSSASHAELRKLNTRLNLIQNCTKKLGGLYVYANASGVDGEARMMFDGSSMILCNGRVLGQSAQFSLVGRGTNREALLTVISKRSMSFLQRLTWRRFAATEAAFLETSRVRRSPITPALSAISPCHDQLMRFWSRIQSTSQKRSL